MLLQILSNTPLWVFGLFVFLIILGVQQSRARMVKAHVIFLLPLGMLALSFAGLISSFGAAMLPVLLWLLSLLLLVYLSFRFFPLHSVRYEMEQNKLQIRGSWTPLLLMMAIFFTKYLVGVVSALKPELLETLQSMVLLSMLYGVFSGIFIGRALSAWSVIHKQQING